MEIQFIATVADGTTCTGCSYCGYDESYCNLFKTALSLNAASAQYQKCDRCVSACTDRTLPMNGVEAYSRFVYPNLTTAQKEKMQREMTN